MTITEKDMPRVAAAGRLAGELLEVHGPLMLNLTDDWAQGAKAANLDPNSRGNRWETLDDGTVVPLPSDPTGEAVLATRADTAAQLRAVLERWHADSLWLRDMAHVLAPVVAPSTMNTKDDLWCTHHLRVGLCEPRHRGTLCRWCYDFKTLWNAYPPMSLLRDRHDGKRVTEQTIKAALAAEGLIVQEVAGVTKAVKAVRGRTGRPNQNEKRKAG